jgi:hypothetical protein
MSHYSPDDSMQALAPLPNAATQETQQDRKL